MSKEAVDQLRNHQRQLDADGCMVGVSRQAIDEVLALLERMEAEHDAYVAEAQEEYAALEVELAAALSAQKPEENPDIVRFTWLTDDHDDPDARDKRRSILRRMAVMSYSAACADIDAAMSEQAARYALTEAKSFKVGERVRHVEKGWVGEIECIDSDIGMLDVVWDHSGEVGLISPLRVTKSNQP